MDIARPELKQRKRRRQVVIGGAILLAVIAAAAGLMALGPAMPSVERSSVLVDTVKRGELLREVRGPGTLVPKEIRWIAAETSARVERVLVKPGAQVEPDTVILELSNPEVDDQLLAATAALTAAQSDLAAKRTELKSRLLDQHAYTEWLELYTPECAYWIPASRPARDPRAQITLEFHDRRRLLDRVARLGTGLAYSQLPASRTARQLSGLEIWASPGRSDEWRARCNFLMAESRAGKSRVLGGWYGFVVRRVGDALRLVIKQVNLLDPDEPQGNNSFFL